MSEKASLLSTQVGPAGYASPDDASNKSTPSKGSTTTYLTPSLPASVSQCQLPDDAIWEPTPGALLLYYSICKIVEQLINVAPIATYMILFQVLLLQQKMENGLLLAGGLAAVVVGITVFIQGLMLGMMPIGQSMGELLPQKLPLWQILLITLVLGVGCTLAEPSIGALETVGDLMGYASFPYVWGMLVLPKYNFMLILAVGAGVGIAAVIGTLKFLYRWPMKRLTILSLLPCLGLSVYMGMVPELASLLGLAWDCGAITTGPVTVPLVLAIGIGVTVAAKKKRLEKQQDEQKERAQRARRGSGPEYDVVADGEEEEEDLLEGFGIVTLASLYPITIVQLVCIAVWATTTKEQILADAAEYDNSLHDSKGGFEEFASEFPGRQILLASRAIIPLALYVCCVTWFMLKQSLPHFTMIDGMVQDGFLTENVGGEASVSVPGTRVSKHPQPDESPFTYDSGGYVEKATPPQETPQDRPGAAENNMHSLRVPMFGDQGKAQTLSALEQAAPASPMRPVGLPRSWTRGSTRSLGAVIHRSESGLARSRSCSSATMLVEAVVTATRTDAIAHARYENTCGDGSDLSHSEGDWEKVKRTCYLSQKRMTVPRWVRWGQVHDAKYMPPPAGCFGSLSAYLLGGQFRLLVRPETIASSGLLAYSVVPFGLLICYLGMIVFNCGLEYGLQALAEGTGSAMPAAYAAIEGYPNSPVYTLAQGVAIVLSFSLMLGCVATLAEPALNVLGIRVESLTKGRFKAGALKYSVSLGVGTGLLLGVCKVMYSWPLLYMLLVGYGITCLLTIFSSEGFVSIAWDCAGVTTGPITVPLVLAVGVAMGNVVGGEGFGILAMSSVCPISTVLGWGLITEYFCCGSDQRKGPAAGRQAELEDTLSDAEHKEGALEDVVLYRAKPYRSNSSPSASPARYAPGAITSE